MKINFLSQRDFPALSKKKRKILSNSPFLLRVSYVLSSKIYKPTRLYSKDHVGLNNRIHDSLDYTCRLNVSHNPQGRSQILSSCLLYTRRIPIVRLLSTRHISQRIKALANGLVQVSSCDVKHQGQLKDPLCST